MINLIPDDIKNNNRYARKNLQLVRYTIMSASTVVAIVLIAMISIASMLGDKNNLQQEIDKQNAQLATYKPIEVQGQQLSDTVATINTLLNRQITFSTLLPEIAKCLPNGAILKQLDFSASDILAGSTKTQGAAPVGGAAGITAKKPFLILAGLADRSKATTLLENIRANKDLFTDADIVDVTQTAVGVNGSSAISSHYPYQVTINAYLKQVNPNQLGKTGTAK